MSSDRAPRSAVTVVLALAVSAVYSALFLAASAVAVAFNGQAGTGVGLAVLVVGTLAGTGWAAWQTRTVLDRVVERLTGGDDG